MQQFAAVVNRKSQALFYSGGLHPIVSADIKRENHPTLHVMDPYGEIFGVHGDKLDDFQCNNR